VLRLTVATLVVFWLAHHLWGARKLEWSAILAALVEERPLLEGPALLLVLLALGSLGVLEEHMAVNLALWVCVPQLVGWSIAYARRQQRGWPTAVTAGRVNGMFGFTIVAPRGVRALSEGWAWGTSHLALRSLPASLLVVPGGRRPAGICAVSDYWATTRASVSARCLPRRSSCEVDDESEQHGRPVASTPEHAGGGAVASLRVASLRELLSRAHRQTSRLAAAAAPVTSTAQPTFITGQPASSRRSRASGDR
jgi:hypothetical protein